MALQSKEVYAEHVLQQGVYLGLLDLGQLLLLDEPPLKDCVILFHEANGDGKADFRMKQLCEIMSDVFSEGKDLLEDISLGEPSTVCYVKCRADFKPASAISELNHYLPVWSRDLVGPANFEVYKQTTVADIATRKAEVCQHLVRVSEMEAEADGDEDTAGLIMSQFASLLHVEKQLDNEEKFNLLLFEKGFVPLHVPGDGNCLIWSFLAHKKGPDGIVDRGLPNINQVRKLRQERVQCKVCPDCSPVSTHVHSFSRVI